MSEQVIGTVPPLLQPGDRVRMTDALKAALRANDCAEHVDEFGECVGIVEGLVNFGNGCLGPEWDVRWQPSNLRYGYRPEDLEKVTT